jgi:hypothetical protein
LVGILSDPNNPFGVYKDFHAVHIFKHDKVHVASLLVIPTRPFEEWQNHRALRLIAPKIALHPQPIVNRICSKLRQATAQARESVEFTEKNRDLPAVGGEHGEQVSPLRTKRKPSPTLKDYIAFSRHPTPGREELNGKRPSSVHEREEAPSPPASSE